MVAHADIICLTQKGEDTARESGCDLREQLRELSRLIS